MADLTVYATRRPQVGETLIGDRFVETLGGKGFNQAIAAARAGAEVTMLGCVGADPRGDAFVTALADHGIEHGGVLRSDRIGTGVGLPFVEASGLNSIVVVPRANRCFGPLDAERNRERIIASDVVCVQLELGTEVAVAVARIARDAGRAVLVNPAPAGEPVARLLALATHLVPNEVEAAMLAGRKPGDDPTECARALAATWPSAEVIVTCGGDGAVHAQRDGQVRRFSAPTVQVVDTIGAGDTFCGQLAAVIARGGSLDDGIHAAVATASASVTRTGGPNSIQHGVEETTDLLPGEVARG